MADQQEANEPTVTIDGKTYTIGDLSEAAQAQVNNIRYVDMELEKLKNQTAVFQAAREFYLGALTKELPGEGQA